MNRLIAFLISVMLASSCQKPLKDVNDYFPKIQTTSAIVQPDGTVLLEGEVESEGAAPIDLLGFCWLNGEIPTLRNNQALAATYEDGKFSTVISDFDSDSVYYFRSWATNNYGYVYGNVLSLEGIIATPVDPPCTLSPNSWNHGAGSYGTINDASEPAYLVDTWNVSADGNGIAVTLYFGSELTTGIYETSASTSPGSNGVYVNFYAGFINGHLNSGSDVYVNTIAPHQYEITICNAPWTYQSGSTFNFNMRFKTPL
jgi:hypothetical protein